jgi:hypothetical protein
VWEQVLSAGNIALGSGGYVAGVSSRPSTTTRLLGLDGASFDTTLEFEEANPIVAFMVERPEGFWLEGAYGTPDIGSGRSAWVGSVDSEGVEQWRKELAPCGTEVPTLFLDAAKSDDGV